METALPTPLLPGILNGLLRNANVLSSERFIDPVSGSFVTYLAGQGPRDSSRPEAAGRRRLLWSGRSAVRDSLAGHRGVLRT